MSDYSDQDIDIRPYIRAVLNRWYWILGLSLLAGVLAYTASLLLLSPVYTATALVTFSDVQQRVEFDRRIVTIEENPILNAYPEIAVSDELLETLRDELPATFTLQQLRSRLRASQGTDPRILKLSVTNSDPVLASNVANIWAEHLVAWANETAGASSGQQLLFFEQRLAEATVSLKAAEEAVVEHQAQDRSFILQNELDSLRETHAVLLAKKGEIEHLLRDIDSLLAISQDDTLANGAAASDQFTVLILRLRTFGGPASAGDLGFPWQLQVNSGDAMVENGPGVVDQVLLLRAVLEVQAEQTETALAEIEPQLLSVQGERQQARAVDMVLIRNLDLATDTYTALAQTVEEKRIKSQEDYSGASLISRSSPPTSAARSNMLLNTVAASAGAAFLSVLIIILRTWWRTDE